MWPPLSFSHGGIYMNKSELMRKLIEKFSAVGNKEVKEYYVSLDAKKYLGKIKLYNDSENDKELLEKINDFLKPINYRATFGGVNLYIMPL